MVNQRQTVCAQLSKGGILIVLDDRSRRKSAVMACLASHAEPDVVNRLVRYARGVIAVAITSELAHKVGLVGQTSHSDENGVRRYTISIDALETTTGISAFDRSLTVKKLAQSQSRDDFRTPGHIFPVVSAPHRLYEQDSIVEGLIDLALIAGQAPLITFADILDAEGNLADEDYIEQLASRLKLTVVKLSEILTWRLIDDGLITSRKRFQLSLNGLDAVIYQYTLPEESFYLGLRADGYARIRQFFSQKSYGSLINRGQISSSTAVHGTTVSILDEMERLQKKREGFFFLEATQRKIPAWVKERIYYLILDDVYRLSHQQQLVASR